jgi:hypothetical protein
MGGACCVLCVAAAQEDSRYEWRGTGIRGDGKGTRAYLRIDLIWADALSEIAVFGLRYR